MQEAGERVNTKCHVIVIVVDSLRKDYSNHLERLLIPRGFISYENAITAAPWTVPSHASIFSGKYPVQHAVHETRTRKNRQLSFEDLGDTFITRLRRKGYATFLFSANPYIHPVYKLKGFDRISWVPHVCNPNITPENVVSALSASPADGRDLDSTRREKNPEAQVKPNFTRINILRRKTRWILERLIETRANARCRFHGWPRDKGVRNLVKAMKKMEFEKNSQPLLLFFNFMEMHEPYILGDRSNRDLMKNLISGYLPATISQWRKYYPLQVRYVNHWIEKLLDNLESRDLVDDSLIIVTSDHGQLLGEHGRFGHGIFLYEELLRVPLFIKYPNNIKLTATNPDLKYISLTRLKPFIEQVISKTVLTDDILYSDTVFSESFGIHSGKWRSEHGTTADEKINQLDKYRIAVYHGGIKGIFNIPEWRFEEIAFIDTGEPADDVQMRQLRNEIILHLKLAKGFDLNRN